MESTEQNYSIEIDRIDEPEWSELLRRFDDATLYQAWQYGAHQYGLNNLTHLVVRRGGRVVSAAQGRVMKVPGVKLGIAHFPWGPMWRSKDSPALPAVLGRSLQALFDHYACRRGLMVRIRSYEVDRESNQETLFPVYASTGFTHHAGSHYQTMRLDLTPSLEELRRRSSSRWRRHLRAAEKKELKVVIGSGDELYREFVRLNDEMYARKSIEIFHPDIDRYRNIQQDLPEHLKMMIFLCEYEGEFVAASVVSAVGNTGMYFFGASSDRAIKENIRASYLLHWRTIEWLKEHGYRWYDLRGYDPKLYPGVSHFKAGLNGEVVGFAEFVGCRNRLSRMTVASAEGIANLVRTAKGKVRVTTDKVIGGLRSA